MDIKRAQEIIESQALIQVHYYGIPVYLKEVNEESETVIVFPLDEMENLQMVDVEGLVETGP